MKIVSIFAERLFSFHFNNETENEYDRLIELWTDVNYLRKFAKNNIKNVDLEKYVSERLEDAEQIIDLIDEISNNEKLKLNAFFRPLSDSEYVIKCLSLQKGKTRHVNRKNDLRIYAIRIDDDCFVITGGAIKLSQSMQENPITNNELVKLNKCKQYLQDNSVFDIESFHELIY